MILDAEKAHQKVMAAATGSLEDLDFAIAEHDAVMDFYFEQLGLKWPKRA